MIRIFICAVASLASVLLAPAATQSIYINASPVNSPPSPAPQIDATAFVNQNQFNVSLSSGLPYQTLNTLFFTNRPSGNMTLTPGYRFDFFTNNLRLGMHTWVNQGSITGSTFLSVSATNIISPGALHGGPQGLIRLSGKNVDLSRARLRSGPSDAAAFFGGDNFGSNYTSAAGVTDIYWGVGTNDHVDNRGMAMQLTGFGADSLNYTSPLFESPFHQVITPSFFGSLFTNIVSVGGFNYGAFVHRTQTSPTNVVVQIVFAPTNSFDTNFTTDVRFYVPFGGTLALPIVQFKATDQDIVTLRENTNAVYLVDYSAFETNLFLARPFGGGTTRRPNIYEFFRTEPFQFRSSLSSNGLPYRGNTLYTPELIYNPNYRLASVTNSYAGYAASLASAASTNIFGGAFVEPTNLVGRVEINADTLNLDQTRIRGESAVIIRTADLIANSVGKVDAPFLTYNLATIDPEMVISNLAPATVRRLSGQVAAWTGRWRNYETTATGTNEIEFHVLIVDNFLNSVAPVSLSEFTASVDRLVIADDLRVQRTLRLDASSIHITGGLTLPFNTPWAHTNIIGLVNFTNSGVLNVAQTANFGADPAWPLENFLVFGTNMAGSQTIRANNVENYGCMVANAGVMEIEANSICLHGKPTILFTNVSTNLFFEPFIGIVTNVTTNTFTNSFGAKIASSSDLQIIGNGMSMSNSYLIAGGGDGAGALILSLDGSLVDEGLDALNFWEASAGIRLLSRPGTSDLMATWATSRAAQFVESENVWSGIDFGATVWGFQNNVALGKLTLDGQPNSLFRFAGHGDQCALYVDYLELAGNATNYNTALSIAPNITIYFAHANISPNKLDGRHNGRLRWVKEFTGPLSSTNITYPSGRTYTFNIGVVQNKDLDSDGDGTVNGEDPTPIYTDDSVDLRVAYETTPAKQAVISWFALGGSTSFVEYKTSLDSTTWHTLDVVTSGASPERLSRSDTIPNIVQQRFYRVRVYPPPL